MAASDEENHIKLWVSDVNRAFDFYANVVGLPSVARWKTGAYLTAGPNWIALTTDPSTASTIADGHPHVVLAVAKEDLPAMRQRILRAGMEQWKPSPDENWLFFCDPDGNRWALKGM